MSEKDTGLSDNQVKSINPSLDSNSQKLASFHQKIVNAYLLSGSKESERVRSGGSSWGEMGKDEIHWWIFKRETNVDGLQKETETLLSSAKKMKDDASILRDLFAGRSYQELVSELNTFVVRHESEITELYHYVNNLAEKDELAPCILFTYRVWGSTNQSERISVNEHLQAVYSKDLQASLETALGLMIRSEPTADWVWMRIMNNSRLDEEDFREYIESEEGAEKWLKGTINRVLKQFYDYFDNILRSARNILIEITEYRGVQHLLVDRGFWSKAVTKAIEFPIEEQLWDFKESLEMWHSGGQSKLRDEVDFCENIAAFANANGGVLVIGISDKVPRRIVGVRDPENRLKDMHDVITKFCNYQLPFTQILPVPIGGKICLLVIAAQTKGVVGVVDEAGKYSYPKRQGTGISRIEQAKIEASKSKIQMDNFNFVAEIDRITSGGFISFSYSK